MFKYFSPPTHTLTHENVASVLNTAKSQHLSHTHTNTSIFPPPFRLFSNKRHDAFPISLHLRGVRIRLLLLANTNEAIKRLTR